MAPRLLKQRSDAWPEKAEDSVVYFAVLDTARRNVLQVEHRRAGAWTFPGGHVAPRCPSSR